MKVDPTLFPILADHTLGWSESLTLGIADLHLYDLGDDLVYAEGV
jgi:hypothetical protein